MEGPLLLCPAEWGFSKQTDRIQSLAGPDGNVAKSLLSSTLLRQPNPQKASLLSNFQLVTVQ